MGQQDSPRKRGDLVRFDRRLHCEDDTLRFAGGMGRGWCASAWGGDGREFRPSVNENLMAAKKKITESMRAEIKRRVDSGAVLRALAIEFRLSYESVRRIGRGEQKGARGNEEYKALGTRDRAPSGKPVRLRLTALGCYASWGTAFGPSPALNSDER